VFTLLPEPGDYVRTAAAAAACRALVITDTRPSLVKYYHRYIIL